MRRIHIFIFFLLITCSLIACKQGQEKPPVPQQKMVDILLDIHLAETYSQGLGDSVKNRFQRNYDSLAGFYKSILKHHNLSFEEFNEAIAWYKQRPILADSLYSGVLTRLAEIKAKAGMKDIEETPAAASPSAGIADTSHFQKDSLMRLQKRGNDALMKVNEPRKKDLKQPKIKAEP